MSTRFSDERLEHHVAKLKRDAELLCVAVVVLYAGVLFLLLTLLSRAS